MPLLVAARAQTTLELRSSTGALVSLSVLFSRPFLGVCGGNLFLLVPDSPLSLDGSYVLRSTTAFGEVFENAPFTVSEQAPSAEVVPLEITATIEATSEYFADSCIDPQLRNRPIAALFNVHVAAPARTPLVLTARVEDSGSAPLADAIGPQPSQSQGDLDLVLELPSEASRCADVELFDLTGSPVFQERLCPEVDRPVTRSLEMTLATVPEQPRPAGNHDGCALVSARSTTGSRGFGWFVALFVYLARRRRVTGGYLG